MTRLADLASVFSLKVSLLLSSLFLIADQTVNPALLQDRGLNMFAVHAVLCFTQLTFGLSYILNKVALNNGMNKFVFSVYRDLVAIAVLSPAFFLEKRQRAHWTPNLAGLIILLGAVGIFGAQILLLTGLSLTTSGFTSIVQNATPVVAFIISIVFGLETIYYQRRDGQAKLLGVLACISGVSVASLLKGPALVGHQSSHSALLPPDGYGLSWKLGALCLVGNSVCMGTYINLQAPVLRRYPAPVSLTALSYFVGATILALVGVITVKDPSAWKVTRFMDALAFVYAGCISSGLNFALQTWCVHKAGPFIVIAYFPLQAISATLMSWLFLHEALHLGSVIGGVLIISGLYLVIWGQAQQQRLDKMSGLVSASNAETEEPLLP